MMFEQEGVNCAGNATVCENSTQQRVLMLSGSDKQLGLLLDWLR
jgi:hypothetical protein